MKPMTLKPDKYIYVGCIPVHACPEHPTDQSPCVLIDCPYCKRPMWYSQNKQKVKAMMPAKVKVYCLECLAIAAYNQDMQLDLFDIGKNK